MPRINHILPLSLRLLILAGALLLPCLSSCSRVQSIREARTIVAEADSLRAAGQSLSPFTFHLSPSKSDSTTIASVVSALEPLRLIYPTAYAHANYYYGRLLREAGNQPAAMLAFLNVVHSHSKDFAVKARSYSNIGTMCNYAGEFAMAYDMYGLSAECFWQANETRLYYYAQNAKALQLAELSLHDETLLLLDSITSTCDDSGVLVKTWETKAFLYVNTQQYDSALHAIHMLHAAGYHDPCGYVKQAQAFWYLEQYDSALYYAQYVMSMPQAAPRDKYNMLYIITFNDSEATDSLFRERYEERADIDKEILDPQNIQYSQAMDLLRQDLNRKPDLSWFYAILVTLLLIGIGITAYVNRKRRQHRLLSQQMNDIQQRKLEEIVKYCGYLQNCTNLEQELCWTNYDRMCEIINRNMYQLILSLQSYDNLTEGDIRLCVLVLIDLSYANMASMLKLSKKSISKLKSIAAHKLNTNMKNLREKLLEIACNSVAK